jgi:hypothetical protein
MDKPRLTLQITIPKQEHDLDILIARLRYLETKECRSKVSEEWRVMERAEVTRQFRQALSMRTLFTNISKNDTEKKNNADDELYN